MVLNTGRVGYTSNPLSQPYPTFELCETQLIKCITNVSHTLKKKRSRENVSRFAPASVKEMIEMITLDFNFWPLLSLPFYGGFICGKSL